MAHVVEQGRFLVEAAAVQRHTSHGLITLVRFPADAAGSVTVGTDDERTVRVSITADRATIAAAVFPSEPPPGRGDAEGFPATSPPRAVHAEILRDLGANSDALAGYLGGGATYAEIRSDGRTSTVVARNARGAQARLELSLTPDEPPVGVPYRLMESLHD